MDFWLFILLISIPICIIVPVVLLKEKKNDKTLQKPSPEINNQPVGYVPNENLVDFARHQLIGGIRFIESYETELKELHNNVAFMKEISVLRIKYSGSETTDTRNVNKDIADYFYYNKFNEKFPQVNSITQKVRNYGKQASAHISIYYAMFLYD